MKEKKKKKKKEGMACESESHTHLRLFDWLNNAADIPMHARATQHKETRKFKGKCSYSYVI